MNKQLLRGMLMIIFCFGAVNAIDAKSNSPEHFLAARFPFVPRLVENHNPKLCGVALQDATKRFMAVLAESKVSAENAQGMKWLDWEDDPELSSPQVTVRRLELDLDNTGKRQILLNRSFAHSWRGDNYYSYVLRSKEALNSLKADPNGPSTVLGQYDSGEKLREEPDEIVPYYPSAHLYGAPANKLVDTGSNWQPHRLFRWHSRYYLYDESNSWGMLTQQFLSLYRLHGNGRVELQCKIALTPAPKHLQDFRQLPGIASFLRVLMAIGSGGVGYCGTLNANIRHDLEAQAAIDRAAFRPWAISRAAGGYFEYNDRMLEFMKDWSFGDIWNRREFQTFEQHVAPATKVLADNFMRRYGLTKKDAAKHAEVAIHQLIGAWIQVPNSYAPGIDRYSVDYSSLTAALMTRDMAALQQALADAKQGGDHSPIREFSDYLHDAVEWPEGLKALLDDGADVNYPRQSDVGYQKTPLMSAAHMNRADSVRLLLHHGANPNLRTVASKDECGMTIKRGSRSALMYAAENAGPEVIHLLLEAGADPLAKDSEGNGMDYYLKNNPRFSAQDKRMDIKMLVKAKLASVREPGFDCTKVTGAVEKQICRDEILKRMDGEMADAYTRWQGMANHNAWVNQRLWIRERNRACGAGEQVIDIGCLQSLMRARVRYLHNRLEESH